MSAQKPSRVVELKDGQAEMVIRRIHDAEISDVLADLEADMRSDPARLSRDRLRELTDELKELGAFANALDDLADREVH